MVVAFYFLEGEFIWDLSGAFRPAFSTLLSIMVVFVRRSSPASPSPLSLSHSSGPS